MILHPHTPETTAFVADHLADGFSIEDVLHDHAFRCEGCGELFSERRDLDYGENNDRICRECCEEANQDALYERRYGRHP